MKADMDGTLHPSYPMLNLMVKIGRPMAAIVAVVVALLGVGAFANGLGLAWGIAGLVGGGIVFVVLRTCVEVLEVISDILLPK
ncbi:MAG: hypothetical protein AB7G13_16790 [Lautropia sp.]